MQDGKIYKSTNLSLSKQPVIKSSRLSGGLEFDNYVCTAIARGITNTARKNIYLCTQTILKQPALIEKGKMKGNLISDGRSRKLLHYVTECVPVSSRFSTFRDDNQALRRRMNVIIFS